MKETSIYLPDKFLVEKKNFLRLFRLHPAAGCEQLHRGTWQSIFYHAACLAVRTEGDRNVAGLKTANMVKSTK